MASEKTLSRLSEVEQRLSADVWAAAISRKMRRLVLAGGTVALVLIIGLGVAICEGVHVNTVLQQQNMQVTRQTQTLMRELHRQNVTRQKEIANVLEAVQDQSQSNGTAISQIEHDVDPGSSGRS
jgi:uncharacterized protein HemX